MYEFVIRHNVDTGELTIVPPKNFVIALGMLEAAREMVLANQVRPQAMPKIVGGVPMPQLMRKGD